MEPFDGSESAENILNRLLEESRAEDAAAVPPSTSEHQHEAVRLSAGTAEVSPEAMRHEENHPRDADMLAVIDDQSSIHQPQHYNGEIRYSHNMQPEQQPQQQLLNPTEMNGAQSGVHGATYNSQRHPQENNLTLQRRVHFHPYQNTQSQQEYATETRSTDASAIDASAMNGHQHLQEQQPLDLDPLSMPYQLPLRHQEQPQHHSTKQQNLSTHQQHTSFSSASMQTQALGPTATQTPPTTSEYHITASQLGFSSSNATSADQNRDSSGAPNPGPIEANSSSNNNTPMAKSTLESATSTNAGNGVIDLLDSDGEEENENEQPDRKRQRLNAIEAMKARSGYMPEWMQQKPNLQPPRIRIVPGAAIGAASTAVAPVGSSLHSIETANALEKMYQPSSNQQAAGMQLNNGNHADQNGSKSMPSRIPELYKPQSVRIPESFTPTWDILVPPLEVLEKQKLAHGPLDKAYSLSLLNCHEFTIEGLSPRYDMPPTPVANLRLPIKKISREYGGATFERDKQNGGMGKWRIPLGAYQNFVSYLKTDTRTNITGIPTHQLQMASLERARQEKGYPTAETINEIGVPKGLALALAPFQRGGVDFVREKGGRALIADDMGLGKTIQGIASMSLYMDEWPVLVLSPSSARYHWESEFQRFLGLESKVNLEAKTPQDRLLHHSQIHVLTSSRNDVLPRSNTRVVICSYGLAPALVESGRLREGQFKCAIVDESHMLKNKATKRTAYLAPILSSAERCVLLSGTPAMARPAELWPQLKILDKRNEWWAEESEFLEKYVRRASSRTRAELHAMLTGTFMIRRLKKDILKTMKPKQRQKTELTVVTPDNRDEFSELLFQLRGGKGELAKIAARHNMKMPSPLKDGPGSRMDEAEEDDKNTRRRVLSRLYSLTGNVKIPWVAEMLRMWLYDPTKGKLCIFAHHINVLNALRDSCGLSNDPASTRKYIRIDGTTTPKLRQQQINSFQNDPTIRVALLGITAAGVAVTLTAASTVWFAELFWTPAIMIQAEDRCHRIGQQGQVQCMYFVGKGTLDELLWKLIEQKFRQLGEFVEGKDKEKLVIDKTFKSINEFKSTFETKDALEEELQAETTEEEQENVAFDASNLEIEIGAFANEEMRELKQQDSDDEEGEAGPLQDARQKQGPPPDPNKEGASEEAAITLSDDEEEETAEKPSKKSEFSIFKSPLEDCLIYKVSFPRGPLGLEITMVGGRPVVVGLTKGRIQNFGANSKPAIGAVLVGIRDMVFPKYQKNTSERAIMHYLRNHLVGPNETAPLMFAESKAIQMHIEKSGLLRKRSEGNDHRAKPPPPSTSSTNDVIEID
mmetsp:Transcript_19542/g.53778  ORF Transcript_19542/g.53778 Transcript_19542/m.53778 type:complete len:1324 (-) Transcript_19542:1673-5644(-)